MMNHRKLLSPLSPLSPLFRMMTIWGTPPSVGITTEIAVAVKESDPQPKNASVNELQRKECLPALQHGSLRLLVW